MGTIPSEGDFVVLNRDLDPDSYCSDEDSVPTVLKGAVYYVARVDVRDEDAIVYGVTMADGNLYELDAVLVRQPNFFWVKWEFVDLLGPSGLEHQLVTFSNYAEIVEAYHRVVGDRDKLKPQALDHRTYDGGKIMDITRSWFEGTGK